MNDLLNWLQFQWDTNPRTFLLVCALIAFVAMGVSARREAKRKSFDIEDL